MKTTRAQIDDFLAQKRLAVVGVSRDSGEFSCGLFRDLRKQGYDVVPVNPAATEIEGEVSFPRVQDITPPVDAVLVMTPAEVSEQIARDCAAAGVSRIWFYQGEAGSATNTAAIAFCEAQGMKVVSGQCPYMFLPNKGGMEGFAHKTHAFFKKLGGSYPK